ncbi:MAG: hypothetical protein R2712_27990 [Vicinamibacterales bacterium]
MRAATEFDRPIRLGDGAPDLARAGDALAVVGYDHGAAAPEEPAASPLPPALVVRRLRVP